MPSASEPSLATTSAPPSKDSSAAEQQPPSQCDARVQMFVSELALRSFHLERDRNSGQMTRGRFRPWTGDSAVLFVDISGYSKLANAVASLGAHALSSVVNGYFERLLEVVRDYGGDVVKFAGDAVIAVWPVVPDHVDDEEAVRRHACVAATACAVALQRHCGRHEYSVPRAVQRTAGVMASAAAAAAILTPGAIAPGEGQSGVLGIHVGVAFGALRSDVLTPPSLPGRSNPSFEVRLGPSRAYTAGSLSAQHLEQSNAAAYHFIGGAALTLAAECVDAAPTGAVCVSAECAMRLPSDAFPLLQQTANNDDGADLGSPAQQQEEATKEARTFAIDVARVEDDALSPSRLPLQAFGKCKHLPDAVRPQVAAQFAIPKTVEHLLMDYSPGEMIEMRTVTVLFIAKVSTAPVKTWFSAVASTLARHGVPLIQAIDDDKGVHVTAAVSFLQSQPDPGNIALRVCQELTSGCGCVVGAATGRCFVGTIGGAGAVRTDFTGWAAVRACRLMQHAQREFGGAASKQLSLPEMCALNSCGWDANASSSPASPTAEDGSTGAPLAVIDPSVAEHVTSRDLKLRRLPEPLTLKGSAEPVHVYTLSYLMGRGADALACIPNVRSLTREIQPDARAAFADTIVAPLMRGGHGGGGGSGSSSAGALNAAADSPILVGGGVLFGPVASGKHTIAVGGLQRESVFAPVVHTVSHGDAPLAPVRSLATYLSFAPNTQVRDAAKALLRTATGDDATAVAQHTLTTQMIELTGAVVAAGMHVALVVRDAHRVSDAFLELVEGVCAFAANRIESQPADFEILPVTTNARGQTSRASMDMSAKVGNVGRFAFVLTGAPLPGCHSEEELVAAFTRAVPYYRERPPLVRVPRMTQQDLSVAMRVWGGDVFVIDESRPVVGAFAELTDCCAAALNDMFRQDEGGIFGEVFAPREMAIKAGTMPPSSRLMRVHNSRYEFSEELLCSLHQRYLLHGPLFPRFNLRVWETLDRLTPAQTVVMHVLAAADEPVLAGSVWHAGGWVLEVAVAFITQTVTTTDLERISSVGRAAGSGKDAKKSRRSSAATTALSGSGRTSSSGTATASDSTLRQALLSTAIGPMIAFVVEDLVTAGILQLGRFAADGTRAVEPIGAAKAMSVELLADPRLAMRLPSRHAQASMMARAAPLQLVAGISFVVELAVSLRGAAEDAAAVEASPAQPQRTVRHVHDLPMFAAPSIVDDIVLAGLWFTTGQRAAATADLAAACQRFIDDVGEQCALHEPTQRSGCASPAAEPRFILWDFATRVLQLTPDEMAAARVPAFEFIPLPDTDIVDQSNRTGMQHASVAHSQRLNELSCPLLLGPLAGLLNIVAHNLLIAGMNCVDAETATAKQLRPVDSALLHPALAAVDLLVRDDDDKSDDEFFAATLVTADVELLERLANYATAAADVDAYTASANAFVEWLDTRLRGRVDRLNRLAAVAADGNMEAGDHVVLRAVDRALGLVDVCHPDRNPRRAAAPAQGVRRALVHLCQPLMKGRTGPVPEETDAALVLVGAMRDALMELAAVNWWTDYHYQVPGAIRDLWLDGDMPAAEVRLMLAAHTAYHGLLGAEDSAPESPELARR